MKSVRKKMFMLFCVFFVCSIINCNTGNVFASSPKDENFNDVSKDAYGSLDVNDLTFSSDGGEHIEIVGCDVLGPVVDNFEGSAILNDYDGGLAAKKFTFTSNKGVMFKLESFYALLCDNNGLSCTSINIYGYNGEDSNPVVSATGIDLSKPDKTTYDGGVTYTRNNSAYDDWLGNKYGGLLEFGNDWYDIDTVVISSSDPAKPLYLALDSIDFSSLTDISIDDTTAAEETDQYADFTIKLTKPYPKPITIGYSVTAGTAKENEDYEVKENTLEIEANKTEAHLKIPIKNDPDREQTEDFNVTITGTSIGDIVDDTANCTITDSDLPPTVTLSADSEINEKDGVAKITATLSHKTYEDVTVELGCSGADGSFYSLPSNIIKIGAGDTTGSVNLSAVANDTYTGDKKVTVDVINTVTGGSKGTFTPPEITIKDDDPVPTVTLTSTESISEDNGSGKITATLTNPTCEDVTVDLGFSGSAVKDTNFTVAGDTITIPKGDTEGQIDITGKNNSLFNKNKELSIKIANATNALYDSGKSVSTTIVNVDPMPEVSISDAETVTESSTGTVEAVFNVKLDKISEEPVTVHYSTSDGTAVAGKDYDSASHAVTISAGDPGCEIKINVSDDQIDEDSESFNVKLSDPDGAVIGTDTAKGTIEDNDDPPTISVGDCSIKENDPDHTGMVFHVSLSGESGKVINVTYNFTDETATKDDDYTDATGGSLTFNPGDKEKEIRINVKDDEILEPDETFKLNLTANNTKNTTCQGTGKIENDDSPELSISGLSLTEDKNITFKVSLSKPCSDGVSVKYRTADGTAIAGSDYTQNAGTIDFAANDTTDKTITIVVNNDSIYEGNEEFYVELYGVTNPLVKIAEAKGTGTIVDNESVPSISVTGTTVNESDSGAEAVFSVTMLPASSKDVTVYYSTSDGTAHVAEKDYEGASLKELKIPAEQTSGEIKIKVSDDELDENDESFNINLSNPSGATIGTGAAVCTIKDNDDPPKISIVDSSATESAVPGDQEMVFDVTLSEKSGKTITVNYDFADGDVGQSATKDSDYDATLGSLTFDPGDTKKQIKVKIKDDSENEKEECFYINLHFSEDDVTGLKAQGKGTITDDDSPSIKVFGDSAEISNGKTVKFADTDVATGKRQIELKISNEGNNQLTLSGDKPYIIITGKDAADFTVETEPTNTIAGKNSTTFKIVFDPKTVGTKTAKATIASDAVNNNSFEFEISGNGTVVSTGGGGSSEQHQNQNTIDVNVGGNSTKVAVTEKDDTIFVNLEQPQIQQKLAEIEKTAPEEEKKVTIPVNNDSDKVVGELKASTLKAMADMDAVLEIQTENATYTLPANAIDVDGIVNKIDGKPELKDITVKVELTNIPGDKIGAIKDAADSKGFELKAPPVSFEISFSNAGKEVSVTNFNRYVERTVAIPDGVDPKKITTGVVYNPDGSFSHVPTAVTIIGDKYFAKINSLTNSTYTLIYNPLTFKDVEKHWSKAYVNDAGSRLIVSGTGNENFTPDRAVTRAEFAVMIVKALGLRETQFAATFKDVGNDNPYYSYIYTAYKYGIISGYTNGNFGPNDLITREQAMSMISKAMKIAEIDTASANTEILNNTFSDAGSISSWAKEGATACANSGLFVGNNGKLNPKSNFTRAESATVVIKLLKKAGLI